MEESIIYILEALINQNIRTYENTNAFLVFTIFSYFFFIIVTSYLLRNLHILARIISAIIAIFLNLFLLINIYSQIAIGKILLNGLSKLAKEDKAPIFKDNLIAQGIKPGSELSVVEPTQLKLLLLILLTISIVAPVYLYIFANWKND